MQLKPKRIKSLFLRDFYMHWRKLGLVTLAVYGVLVVIMIITAWSSDDRTGDFHNHLFPFLLLIGGFLFTSANYTDFRTHLSRVAYLSLPASNLEKLVTHLLYVTLGFVVYLVVTYWVVSSLMNIVCSGIFRYDFQSLIVFSGTNWLLIKLYLVLHALFLVGSISFNRYTSIKTILSVIVFTLAIIAVSAVLFRIIYYDQFQSLFELKPDIEDNMQENRSIDNFFTKNFPAIIKILFWYLLAPVLWVISYFKMKEKEA